MLRFAALGGDGAAEYGCLVMNLVIRVHLRRRPKRKDAATDKTKAHQFDGESASIRS